MFIVILIFIAAFVVQYILTYLQMRSFTRVYKEYRHEGYRAAIGRFSGKLRAGAITMFAIDHDGIIIKGTAMQGVTVLARFKNFDKFNGRDVGSLTKEDCKALRLSSSMTEAILNGTQNYNTVMRGDEVPTPPSPFQKAGNVLSSGFKRLTGNSGL